MLYNKSRCCSRQLLPNKFPKRNFYFTSIVLILFLLNKYSIADVLYSSYLVDSLLSVNTSYSVVKLFLSENIAEERDITSQYCLF